jgi:hypothetical protein
MRAFRAATFDQGRRHEGRGRFSALQHGATSNRVMQPFVRTRRTRMGRPGDALRSRGRYRVA